MKTKKHSLFLLLMLALPLVLTSCVIFGDQVIYEDPDHVDFDPELPAKDEDELQSEYGDQPYLEAGDVRIYYAESAASYVEDTSETVPSSTGEEMYAVAHPDFVFFNFSGMKAKVYVARVDLYESAAEFAPGIIADLHRMIDGTWDFVGCIPELPLDEFYRVCDHQEFHSNVKNLKFGNGSGVRFVTAYGIQAITPVGNNNLEYVFQGLTDDGKFYVKVIVEMMHSSLDGIGEIPDEIAAGSAEDVQDYFASFAQTFEQNESDFTPQLDWVDQVIRALSFE
jgi:hypothetical protein